MELLEQDVYYRALVRRDPRFDGLLFIGVTSIGICSRAACPPRIARPEYCRFFGSAAAVQDAGFRHCLRCPNATCAVFRSAPQRATDRGHADAACPLRKAADPRNTNASIDSCTIGPRGRAETI